MKPRGNDMENLILKQDNNFTLEDVFVMDYEPKLLFADINFRSASTFLYIKSGEYKYTGEEVDFLARKGDCVYIPRGASYSFSILSSNTHAVQLTFNLIKTNTREYIAFADNPTLIKGYVYPNLFDNLINDYCNGNSFSILSDIYKIIANFYEYQVGKRQKTGLNTIRPAVSYIKEHYCDKIYVKELAKMCSVSETHLRRLFKECIGVSPLKYKNTLLINAACSLMTSERMSVGEIAETLAFPDIYTFSQFFKKEVGMSPTAYIKDEL